MTAKVLPELTAFDLRLLQVFDAVVQVGSFTAAQVKLNKSKSAISTDIAALETRLGVRLCQRGRAGFSLTDQGEEVHKASPDGVPGCGQPRRLPRVRPIHGRNRPGRGVGDPQPS